MKTSFCSNLNLTHPVPLASALQTLIEDPNFSAKASQTEYQHMVNYQKSIDYLPIKCH